MGGSTEIVIGVGFLLFLPVALLWALMIGVGGVAILQFFNYYHEKAILEFILGILFFVITIAFLKYDMRDSCTIESLAKIYHVEVSKLFIAFFGFVV